MPKIVASYALLIGKNAFMTVTSKAIYAQIMINEFFDLEIQNISAYRAPIF